MLDLIRWFSRPRRSPARTTRPQRNRLGLENLEDRTVPALVTYDAATDALQLTGDLGEVDNVFITAPAADQVLIQVTGSDTLVLGGDAVGHPDFTLSADLKSLTIHTEPLFHSPIAQLTANLGDQDDTFVLGLADPNHHIGSILVDGQDGSDTVHLNALTLPGSLSVTADVIAVHQAVGVTDSGSIDLTADQSIALGSGSRLSSVDGDITLKANQGMSPVVGNFIGIRLINADIATVNGDILLQGRGGDLAGSGLHAGIDITNGSTIVSTGFGVDAGRITLEGTGGVGTSQNYGVVLEGDGSHISSVDGTIMVTGDGGASSTQFNIGVLVYNGGQVISTGTAPITITGTGGTGTDYNYGVDIEGPNTLIISVVGDIQVTGIGGLASGQQNVGVSILNGAVVSSTGIGPDGATITVHGTGGTGDQFNAGVHINGTDTQLTTIDGGVQIEGQATAEGSSEHGVMIVASTLEVTGEASLTLIGVASQAPGATGDGVLLLTGAAIRSLGHGFVDVSGTAAGVTAAPIEWDALTLEKTGGQVTFHDKVRGTSLDVLAGGYAVVFLDGGDVTSPVTFHNTGGVTFGDAATDVMNFHGGVSSTAGQTIVHGTLQTSNDDIHLGQVTLRDALVSAGTATVYLSGHVTLLASTVPGRVFGTIDLGGNRDFTIEDGIAVNDLTLNNSLINGSLTKNGPGTLQLLSGSTYADGTLINDGILRVNNGTGSGTGTGPVLVMDATLSGNGTITGQVEVVGGVVSPGDVPEFIRSGGLFLTGGAEFRAVLNAPYEQPGTHYDGIQVTGSVTLNNASLVLSGGAVAPNDPTSVFLIQNDGDDAVNGIFAGLPEGAQVSVGNFVGRITYRGGSGNDVVLRVGSGPGPIQKTDSGAVKKVIAYGSPNGWKPVVRIHDAVTKTKVFQFLAYPKKFRGGVRVAVGDVNGDGHYDVVTVPGQGASPNLVKVYDGKTGQLIGAFRAAKSLAGRSGMFVAVGDTTGDGQADIVLGSGRGAKAKVFVVSGATLTPVKSYSVTAKGRAGGVQVRLFDLNGDGIMEIVT